jgi:hypothetical protein
VAYGFATTSIRLRSTGASSAFGSAARCGDSSGGISAFYTEAGIPRRVAGPEEDGPATLRARFRATAGRR